MPMDRFIIAPYDRDSGLQNDIKPWLIPDEAFSELTNAYVFRGRVRKRFGSRWLGETSLVSRLRFLVGTITGGNISGNVRTIAADTGMPTAVGQAFSIGNIVFTVVSSTPGPQNMLRSDGTAALATFNITNSDFVINGVALPDATEVYFYLGLPVMGLLTYDISTINNEFVIGFDERYAYQYIANTGWDRLSNEASPGDAVWTGDNSQFFWEANWTGVNAFDRVFFVTNYNQNEPNFMRYFFANTWNTFRPKLSNAAGPVIDIWLDSALLIIPFKNRLVVLNTWETETSTQVNYVNRARYSQPGSPLSTDAWRQDIPGKGNFIDAATIEAIVSAEFVKDRLIVFFERSTWELVWTNNQAYPFIWQQINTELGAESTFSIVPFDRVAFGVGNVGIMACNGANVERIDSKIPDEVFAIHNANEGIFRVYGIRDYYVEMVYWTFPSQDANADFPYPNRVLIYNYKNATWAFNDDSITAFGYFQPQSNITWDSNTITWDDEISWDSGSVQSLFRQVVAGNQEGYTFICDADVTTNASVLQITNLTVVNNVVTITAIDHNMREGEYLYFENITQTIASMGNLTLINGKIFQVISDSTNPITPDMFSFIYQDDANNILTGVYSGGGVMARVSNIGIRTKEYNFYEKQGRNAFISKIDFMVQKTDSGQIQANFFVSTATDPLLQESAGNGVLLGTGTLDTFPYTVGNAAAPIPFEANTSRLWHPVYFQADGEFVQFYLNMNDAQMRDVDIRESDFQMHAMVIYTRPTSYRFQ